MKYFIYSILLVFTFTSCEKTILLDVAQTPERVVIEGLVGDQPGYQYVKVSKSTSFYSTGKSPRVTNATIQVEDDMGNTFSFVHNPSGGEDSVGYYLPATPFTGVVGRTYTLTVIIDGQSYQATDKINWLVPIEKLEYAIDEDEQRDPEDPGRFYELLLFVNEPQDTKDFYFFKSYRNGQLEYESDTDIYYADDEFIGERIDGIPMPLYYAENEVAGVEVYSLSREAFVFYRDLEKLLNNDGGMFNTPPADPRTNLSNGAIGFFQASAIVKGELVIGQ